MKLFGSNQAVAAAAALAVGATNSSQATFAFVNVSASRKISTQPINNIHSIDCHDENVPKYSGNNRFQAQGDTTMMMMMQSRFAKPSSSSSHLQMSRRNFSSKPGKRQWLADKVKKVAKSILPKRWFQSEEEKRAEESKKAMQRKMSNEINEALSNAPLVLRMLGRAVAPILTKMASSASQMMQEQQASAQQVLTEARELLANDPAVVNVLGEPLQIGSPISQASSTTSINGETMSQIQLSVQVAGSYEGGIATITSSNGKISSIQLQAGQRLIQVKTVMKQGAAAGGYGRSRFGGGGGVNGSSGSSSNDDDNVIDAEIIEKKKDA
eukprot:CAMPEP_0119561544 /NCGR_PEP_ID=MMETSP1352-20130426/17944_1 /TAXON_ID=265584 /ORGANISM="Stauroneis constricta, Strain CCMP1120" /LENGTH=325 /DNA_ID=CAMNT_0007609769 /DNA_START=40 /DNA_END=1017 /DNA_ORIENTATION=-